MVTEATSADAKPKRERIAAKTFDEKALQRIIQQLDGAKGSNNAASGGRFRELHSRIQKREMHFYNEVGADPRLPDPHNSTAAKFQTDRLRRVWVDLKARLCENAPIITANPPSSGRQEDADALEKVLQRGYENILRRTGTDVVGELVDGMTIDCYALLHWEKSADVWPDYPDYEAVTIPPADAKRRQRYRKDPETEGDYAGKYRETDESLHDRAKRERAEAGFPYTLEVIHPSDFSFVADRSMRNGFGGILITRRVPLLDYQQELEEKDSIYVRSLNDRNKNIAIYEERNAPTTGDPSADALAWGKEVVIKQWWTRDEFYELAQIESGGLSMSGFKLVKSFPHKYGMAPFALCKAHETNAADPAKRYLPVLEGMYKLKPFYDYYRTLMLSLAQQIALPLYYLEDATGKMGLDSDGKPIVLTRDALAAQQLPPGYSLKKVEFELNPAFVAAMEQIAVEFHDAEPGTGATEITGTTQPWTARLGMTMANVEPSRLLDNIVGCLAICWENILHCMALEVSEGGVGETPVLDGDEVISITPEQVRGLTIDVSIPHESAGERITIEEHYRALLDDPNVPVTRRMFVEDGMGRSDATEIIAEWRAERDYEEYLDPQVVQQELARIFDEFVVFGASGQFAGPGGQVVDPAQRLRAKGWQVPDVPAPPGPSSAPPGAEPVMNPLPEIATPNTPVMAGTA